MQAMSFYVHNIPGRLRIKIPTIKGNPSEAGKVEAILASEENISSITVKPLTGSVTVLYNPKALRPEKILMNLTRNGYFDPSLAVTNDEWIKKNVSKAGQVLSRTLFGFCVDAALENAGLGFLAVLV